MKGGVDEAGADRRFAAWAALAQDRLGINLRRGGLTRSLERLVQRRTLGSCPPAPSTGPGSELQSDAFQALVEAVTVQHSWLFRDPQQLELACSALGASAPSGSGRQVWVPACATGEDVYSLLALCHASGLGAEVLGTDVCRSAVMAARMGDYGSSSVRHVPDAHRGMLEGTKGAQRVVDRLRRGTRFEVHNLLDVPPRSNAQDGKWDLILCRNVLIYFAPRQVARALCRLRDALCGRGILVLGASDILTQVPDGLVPVEHGGRLFFQRADRPTAAQAPVVEAAAPAPSTLPAASAVAAPAGAASEPVDNPCDREDADVEAMLLRGIRRHVAGQLHAALRDLRAALFLRPELWPASYYLALTHEALGQHDAARRAYREVLRSTQSDRACQAIAGSDFSFLRRDVIAIACSRLEAGQ